MSPPHRATTCDGELQIVTQTEYLLVNKLKVRNFMWGLLNELGVLILWMENVPQDGYGCPGWWMFDQMMDYFRPNVVAIKGTWTYGDNLEKVNLLTSAGDSIESAALQCPTGKYSAKHGYRKVSLISTVGSAGAYSLVHVLFERP
jgi:hypothetical protein